MRFPIKARLAAHIAMAFALVMSVVALPERGVVARDAATCGGTQVPVAGGCIPSEQAAAALEKIAAREMAANDMKAVIARVTIGGRPIVTKAWGESMTGVPAHPEMHFRNGAVAITYMGVLLLRLQEEGVLNAADKLARWFPQYPMANDITLGMLMNSTSGYADYVNLSVLPLYADVFRQWKADELIGIGLDQPMKCRPGTCFAYAHTNYVILGEVFGKATGKSLEDLLRKHILEPLALRNTRSESTPHIQPPVLHAFDGERGVYEDSTYWNPSWTLAPGAVMTTDIYDLATSAEAIGSGRLVSRASYLRQVAPTIVSLPPFSDRIYYGMGVVVSNGWIVQVPRFAGYAAAMGYDPRSAVAIAVVATSGAKAPDVNLAQKLLLQFTQYLTPDMAPEPIP